MQRVRSHDCGGEIVDDRVAGHRRCPVILSVQMEGEFCQCERLAARLMGRLVSWVGERGYLRTVLQCTPSWREIARRDRP